MNDTAFVVRKELTPVEGDTKCSIYLSKPLDYEIHSSYVMQIIAEVSYSISLSLSHQLLTKAVVNIIAIEFPVIH